MQRQQETLPSVKRHPERASAGRRLPDVVSVLLATGQYELAFEKIYERLFGKVYGFIAKRIAAGEDAEDLTQDVFLQVYRHLPNYDAQRASLETWVFVIAKNKLKNHYRDRKETRSLDDDARPLHLAADVDLAEAYELQEMRDELAKLLWQLPEIDRQIVVLRYFRGVTSQTAADLLGMTSGNVRVRLSRALDKLARFAEEAKEDAEEAAL